MRDAAINLRALPEQRDLIDQAASLLGKNRSDFMLEAACDRALVIGAVTYSSVNAILKAGLDKIQPTTGPLKPTPAHGNIRGGSYYQ